MIRPQAKIGVGLATALFLLAAPATDAKPSKAPLPDLVVAKVSKPAAATAGSQLSLSVQVRNKGRGAAGRSSVGVYLATGKKHTAKDPRLLRAKIKPLRAGKSAKATLKLTIPVGAAGSHRLVVCADDARGVRESKESDNCTASAGFAVATAPPAPAFSVSDGFDWGRALDAEENSPGPGAPLSVTLRAANGVAGQAGYSFSKAAPMPMVGGSVTTLDYTGKNLDDSGLTVQLPFAFPFGGINEHSASVSTNGRLGFGSAAADWWEDTQENDYRGAEFVVGNFERAIMPFWGDFNLEARETRGAGTIKEVVAQDNSFVAFQWEIGQENTAAPRRNVQLVLFPDGRFRFDYPGENLPTGNRAFIGYSLGTGAVGLEALRQGVTAVPANSFQFVPNPVPSAGAIPAGQVSLTLPPGSAFVSGDAGCSVSTPPTPGQPGLASCSLAALAPGGEAVRTVTFTTPANAIGQTRPANFRYLGTYTAGGVALTDADELDALSSSLPPTKIVPTVTYVAPPANPKVGQAAQFSVTLKSSALDTPSVTLKLPADTALNSIQIGNQDVLCGPTAGGEVTCQLPSGMRETKPPITVTVTPTADAAGDELVLGVSAQALNAPLATGSGKSPAVEP